MPDRPASRLLCAWADAVGAGPGRRTTQVGLDLRRAAELTRRAARQPACEPRRARREDDRGRGRTPDRPLPGAQHTGGRDRPARAQRRPACGHGRRRGGAHRGGRAPRASSTCWSRDRSSSSTTACRSLGSTPRVRCSARCRRSSTGRRRRPCGLPGRSELRRVDDPVAFLSEQPGRGSGCAPHDGLEARRADAVPGRREAAVRRRGRAPRAWWTRSSTTWSTTRGRRSRTGSARDPEGDHDPLGRHAAGGEAVSDSVDAVPVRRSPASVSSVMCAGTGPICLPALNDPGVTEPRVPRAAARPRATGGCGRRARCPAGARPIQSASSLVGERTAAVVAQRRAGGRRVVEPHPSRGRSDRRGRELGGDLVPGRSAVPPRADREPGVADVHGRPVDVQRGAGRTAAATPRPARRGPAGAVEVVVPGRRPAPSVRSASRPR